MMNESETDHGISDYADTMQVLLKDTFLLVYVPGLEC